MNDPRVITAPAGYVYFDDEGLAFLASAGVTRTEEMRATRDALITTGALVLR